VRPLRAQGGVPAVAGADLVEGAAAAALIEKRGFSRG
jgi:hypothetical protein